MCVKGERLGKVKERVSDKEGRGQCKFRIVLELIKYGSFLCVPVYLYPFHRYTSCTQSFLNLPVILVCTDPSEEHMVFTF